MGAEPFFVRKPFMNSPETVLKRFYDEILKSTHDWPEVKISAVADYFSLTAIEDQIILDLFGTKEPESELSSSEIENLLDNIWEKLERGKGHYLYFYKNGVPVEVCFFGYSLD